MEGLCITIVRNTAINLLRRQKRILPLEDDVMEALYQEENAAKVRFPEEMAVEKEEAELIRRLLRELPAVYHDILVLRYYYGLSVKEAAKILGISQNAAQVRLHRAKEKLGKALGEEGIK